MPTSSKKSRGSTLTTDRNAPPARRGVIYCSPWCGFCCTWEAHQRATQEAEALVKRLGPGWTPKVWENSGWHYSAEAVYGPFRITPRTSGSHISGDWKVYGYTAWINTTPQFIEDAETPEAAFAAALTRMHVAVKHLTRDMGTAKALAANHPQKEPT